jgi:hypothetical protein
MAVTTSIFKHISAPTYGSKRTRLSLDILEDRRALAPQEFLKQLLRTAYRIRNLKTTLNLGATTQSHLPTFVAVT